MGYEEVGRERPGIAHGHGAHVRGRDACSPVTASSAPAHPTPLQDPRTWNWTFQAGWIKSSNRVTRSLPLILKMKTTKSREKKLPPKTQSEFPGARGASASGSQHAAHFLLCQLAQFLMFPGRRTRSPMQGDLRPGPQSEGGRARARPHGPSQALPPHPPLTELSHGGTTDRCLNLSDLLGEGFGDQATACWLPSNQT